MKDLKICCSLQSSQYVRLDHRISSKKQVSVKNEYISVDYINPYKISKDDEQLNAFYILKMKFARQQ